MTTTADTPRVTAAAPRTAAWRPRPRSAAEEAQRLMPRPLLAIVTAALCAIVV
ncbi:MAG: hypothetical protein QOC94_2806, partial [Actinoplanes sp.]|nr:hypothetical protein [Actinoplanes sp.]